MCVCINVLWIWMSTKNFNRIFHWWCFDGYFGVFTTRRIWAKKKKKKNWNQTMAKHFITIKNIYIFFFWFFNCMWNKTRERDRLTQRGRKSLMHCFVGWFRKLMKHQFKHSLRSSSLRAFNNCTFLFVYSVRVSMYILHQMVGWRYRCCINYVLLPLLFVFVYWCECGCVCARACVCAFWNHYKCLCDCVYVFIYYWSICTRVRCTFNIMSPIFIRPKNSFCGHFVCILDIMIFSEFSFRNNVFSALFELQTKLTID